MPCSSSMLIKSSGFSTSRLKNERILFLSCPSSHRLTPRHRPRYLDTEYRMPLAHQLREPELVGTGVYEIQGKLSPAFLQLNHRGLSLALWLPSINQPCHLLHGRIAEQLRHAETDFMPSVDFADQPEDRQGMAAQVEEVVIYAHPFDAENLLPNARQLQLP